MHHHQSRHQYLVGDHDVSPRRHLILSAADFVLSGANLKIQNLQLIVLKFNVEVSVRR
jgi:hypothetical protein